MSSREVTENKGQEGTVSDKAHYDYRRPLCDFGCNALWRDIHCQVHRALEHVDIRAIGDKVPEWACAPVFHPLPQMHYAVKGNGTYWVCEPLPNPSSPSPAEQPNPSHLSPAPTNAPQANLAPLAGIQDDDC